MKNGKICGTLRCIGDRSNFKKKIHELYILVKPTALT